MNSANTKAAGRATPLRRLHAPLRCLRSNAVSFLALAVAVGTGGSYAIAASANNGTIAVCVDKGSDIMHLAKHSRCGRRQSRIGLSSALNRPTVSAWAASNEAGDIVGGAGVSISHVGVGVYNITLTAASCRDAANNAPVVSPSDTEPPGGQATPTFPVAWTSPASTGIEAFTIYTGVVVSGAFQPKDGSFNFTDSCT